MNSSGYHTRARMCVCECVWNQTPVLARSNKIRLFGTGRPSLSQGGPSGQRPGHGASHRPGCAGTHLRSCVAYQVLHRQACTRLHMGPLCVSCRWDRGSANGSKSLAANASTHLRSTDVQTKHSQTAEQRRGNTGTIRRCSPLTAVKKQQLITGIKNDTKVL